jgi:hypothetical protein
VQLTTPLVPDQVNVLLLAPPSLSLEGFVEAILSGDSPIIRFPNSPYPRLAVALLFSAAPKCGSLNGLLQDEPYGWDSWSFLRELALRKPVSVKSDIKPGLHSCTHSTFSGQIPVPFSRVKFIRTDEDIVFLAIAAGWVKIIA